MYHHDMKHPGKLWLIIVLSIFISSCSRQEQQGGLLIAVSIPPQAWFVSQIAGDKAGSLIIVPSGQNPHNYEPTPRQLQSLTTASAWILSGLEFEISLLPRVEPLFPNLLIVDGTQGVNFRLLEEPCLECSDLPFHVHSFLEIDRHTWLGRESAKVLGRHIRDTLSRLDNENQAFYHERYENLVREIDAVFEELKTVLAPLYGRSVFVYHSSFGYFLDEFGIRQEAVETGGSEPTPRQLNNLMAKIIEERPAAIFVQTQFPVTAARTLANAVDAQLIELDPLAIDWLDNIRRLGKSLSAAVPMDGF